MCMCVGVVWLVDIVVLPMGYKPIQLLQSFNYSAGDPCFVQWLASSIHLCICQALQEPLRIQLYQAPDSKYFLASTIVSGFGVCIWDGSPGGAISAWPFLQSLVHALTLCFSCGYFVPPSKKDQSFHTLVFILFELHVVCG